MKKHSDINNYDTLNKILGKKSDDQEEKDICALIQYIMLDKKLKPWLLEVNESPSFNDDTQVDRDVKGGLIEDTFRLLDIKKN